MMDAPLWFDLETEVRELFDKKIREFVAFCGQHWTMTEAEAETLTDPTPSPAAYARGYTEAMQDGLQNAADHWLDEEMGYGR